MSHVINRIVVDRDCSKDEVLSEIREEVFHEDWEEGGQYHENLNWHDGKVYANYEEAVAAIEKFDNGLYDDHAVLFHDLDALEPTERENKAAEDVDKAYQDWIRVVKDGRANARSTKLVTCSHCSSKIAVSFLPDNRNRCPVCGRVDLRTKKAIDAAERAAARFDSAKKNLEVMKSKRFKSAPVKWLVKYEYHV